MESENVGLLKKESPFPGADFQATFQTSGVYMQLLLKPSELLKQTTWDEQKLQSDIPWILMTSHTSSPDFSPQKPSKTYHGSIGGGHQLDLLGTGNGGVF